jgi:hypothetical protein
MGLKIERKGKSIFKIKPVNIKIVRLSPIE